MPRRRRRHTRATRPRDETAMSHLTYQSFGGTKTAPTTPGTLDEWAEIAFTRGNCHTLAREVSRLTGWATVRIGAAECTGHGLLTHTRLDDDLCTCQVDHVAAIAPNGELVDITGAWQEQEAAERWPVWATKTRPTIAPIATSVLDELAGGAHGWLPAPAGIETWASALVELVELDWATRP